MKSGDGLQVRPRTASMIFSRVKMKLCHVDRVYIVVYYIREFTGVMRCAMEKIRLPRHDVIKPSQEE